MTFYPSPTNSAVLGYSMPSQSHSPQRLTELLPYFYTALPENIGDSEPRQLFLEPVWYLPSDDENPVSLLGE
jgi:hypothetical protein